MKKFFFAAFAALAFSFVACDKEDETPINVVELAKSDARFTTLVTALGKAGLVATLESTEATVFAPTNDAFKKFLADNNFANLDAVPANVLKQTLLNHVVAGTVKSTDLTAGYVKTLATFAATTFNLSLLVAVSPSVKLNKTVSVTEANLLSEKGVVHVVDQVIALPSVVSHALNNSDFTSLVAALTRSDLGVDYPTILSGAGPFTVFAPTNAAFAALLTETGFATLNDIPKDLLNAVLQYHVVSGAAVRAGDLTDNQKVTSFQGQQFTIGLTGGAKITDARSRVSKIVATDVTGTNGVVHVLDKVILPN